MAAKTVDEYVANAPDAVRETLKAARKLLAGAGPNIDEFMKWGTPAYGLSESKPLFYLYAGKEHVNLGFLLGAQLDDPKGLLEGAGKKDSRHVRLGSPKDLKSAALKKLIKDSVKAGSE